MPLRVISSSAYANQEIKNFIHSQGAVNMSDAYETEECVPDIKASRTERLENRHSVDGKRY